MYKHMHAIGYFPLVYRQWSSASFKSFGAKLHEILECALGRWGADFNRILCHQNFMAQVSKICTIMGRLG